MKPTPLPLLDSLIQSAEDLADRIDRARPNSRVKSLFPPEIVDRLLREIDRARVPNYPECGLTREELIKKLGDWEFYLEGVRLAQNITREEVMEALLVSLGSQRIKETS